MADVQLVVDGIAYGGWKSVDVKLGVDRIAGTFELSVAELWPQQKSAREIPPGARCELRLDDETVITGWVDENEPEYAHDRHEVAVRGRDATGDLVDCAAIHKSGQWANQTITQIAKDLCAPFGIKVRATTDVGAPFPEFKIHKGDSVFETLGRAARQRGVMLVSDGKGGVLIARAGKTRAPTALVLGENIRSARGKKSYLERFSKYFVTGQGIPRDETAVDQVVDQQGQTLDKAVKRYRPLIVQAEDSIDTAAAKDRATWERNVRAGRSVSVTYTVKGWKHRTGLWKHDQLVSVRDPYMRIARDLYISAVRYKLDEQGSTADLTVTLPEAYSLLAIPEREDFV